MQDKGGRDGYGDIENPTLKRQRLRPDLIRERGLRMARFDGQSREQGEAAHGVAAMGQFRVGQVHPGLLQALLQVGQIVRCADFADPQNIRVNSGQ